jgi:hypothetical protein
MIKFTCEEVRIAAMAIADGEDATFSLRQIEEHIAGCIECLKEIEQLKIESNLLNKLQRRPQSIGIWPGIEEGLRDLSPQPRVVEEWTRILLLGIFLTVYKLVELIPDRPLGLMFRLVPILLVILAFGFLKENPFKIKTDLKFEGV